MLQSRRSSCRGRERRGRGRRSPAQRLGRSRGSCAAAPEACSASAPLCRADTRRLPPRTSPAKSTGQCLQADRCARILTGVFLRRLRRPGDLGSHPLEAHSRPVLSLGSLRLWVAVVSTLALVADAAATVPANAPRTAVRQIAFAVHHGDGDAPWDIYVVRTDGRWVVKKTTKGLDEDDPVWSPDGRHIAFDGWTIPGGADTSIYTMNPDGTHRRRIARGYGPQWSPDGRRIAYDGSNGVYVINVDGTGKKRVARGGGPRWSPDGKQIAFTHEPGDVYVVNPFSGGERRVTRTGGDSRTEAWAPG